MEPLQSQRSNSPADSPADFVPSYESYDLVKKSRRPLFHRLQHTSDVELVDSQAEVLRRSRHPVKAQSPPGRIGGDIITLGSRGERIEEDFGWVGSFSTRSESRMAVHNLSKNLVENQSTIEDHGNELSDHHELQTTVALQGPSPAIIRDNHVRDIVNDAEPPKLPDEPIKSKRTHRSTPQEKIIKQNNLSKGSRPVRRIRCCF